MEEIIARNTTPQQVLTGNITGITVGLLTASEIRSQSVVEVTSLSMEPSQPGLHNEKLGSINRYTPCGTCNQFVDKCTMHWGHITLPEAIIYPEAKSLVVKLLNSFCDKCLKNEEDKSIPDDQKSMKLSYTDDVINKYINVAPEKRLAMIDKNEKGVCRYGKCITYKAIANSSAIGIERKIKTEAQAAPAGGDNGSPPKKEKKTQVVPISMLELVNKLNRMDREDLLKLGISVYPASLYVFDTIPVPPLSLRPPDSLTGRPHLITNALRNIIAEAQNPKEDRAYRIENAYKLYVMVDEEMRLPNSNDSILGIKSIIDKKSGHVRSVMNGKRTNHCARSAVSPDPNLGIDQIGIPRRIADYSTTTEVMYRLNIHIYRDALEVQRRYGEVEYLVNIATQYKDYNAELARLEAAYREASSGNNNRAIQDARREMEHYRTNYNNVSLVRKYGMLTDINQRIKIKYVTRRGRRIFITPVVLETFRLREGDIVHRTLMNGDPVTLGRQPSLHKFSILGGLVSIKPYYTIGVHPSYVAGFNMDFDGPQ